MGCSGLQECAIDRENVHQLCSLGKSEELALDRLDCQTLQLPHSGIVQASLGFWVTFWTYSGALR